MSTQIIHLLFEILINLFFNSNDNKDVVDQSIERAKELEPEIVDPSKLNLVVEVSTKVNL